MKSTLKAIALILTVIAVASVAFGFWYGRTSGAFIRASDVQVADAGSAVRDARQLIDNYRATASPDERPRFLQPNQLPDTLRLPKLRHAVVFRDHVNLVLGRNPDWSIGARVWSADTTTIHADEPTSYPDIFFFQYTNDAPTSPKNIL